MPVINRAGVTSKAGLAARVPSGASRTRAGVPSASTPLICVTSSAARSSISIARPALERPVDGAGRCGDIERHVVVGGRQRLQIGADLVAGVAACGDAVGADQAEIDLAVLHQMAAGIVGDQRVRHAMAGQLPGREAGALVARPRLVDPDMHRDAVIMRAVDDAERRAPVDAGDPAGVAMGEDVDRPGPALAFIRVADQRQSVLGDRSIGGDVLFGEPVGHGKRRIGPLGLRQAGNLAPHDVERPAQIDRRRPRRQQPVVRGGKARIGRITVERNGQPIGAADADQRRAAHGQRADRLGNLVLAGEVAEGETVRQHRLVEHGDAALARLAEDRSVGASGDFHFAQLRSKGWTASAAIPDDG